MFFSTDLFNKISGESHFVTRSNNLGNGAQITFYMGGVQVLAAMVGIYVFDKIGRRHLLIWGPLV